MSSESGIPIKAVASADGHAREDSLGYQKAIASRNHGIGGNRVSLDYDNFLSIFAYPQAISLDSLNRPRIVRDHADLSGIRATLSAMILNRREHLIGTDWQAVTDMIVSRYANQIRYLTSGKLETLQDQDKAAFEPGTKVRAQRGKQTRQPVKEASLGRKATIDFGLVCWSVSICLYEDNHTIDDESPNQPKANPDIREKFSRRKQSTVRRGCEGKPISLGELVHEIKRQLENALVSATLFLDRCLCALVNHLRDRMKHRGEDSL